MSYVSLSVQTRSTKKERRYEGKKKDVRMKEEDPDEQLLIFKIVVFIAMLSMKNIFDRCSSHGKRRGELLFICYNKKSFDNIFILMRDNFVYIPTFLKIIYTNRGNLY